MAKLPSFEETEELPEFSATEGLPEFGETEELPAFSATEEVESPSMLESGVRGLAQGALFEFADEAEAGVRSALQGRDYQEELDRIRGEYARAEEANPGVTLATNLAGGIGSAFLPGIGAIGNVARGASLGKIALAGAAQGGLTELGRSDKTDLADTAADVAKGAALGAGLGAGLSVATRQGSKILGGLKDVWKGKTGEITPDVDILKLAEESYAPFAKADAAFAKELHAGKVPVAQDEIDKLKEFAYYLHNPSTISPESGKLGVEATMETLKQRAAQMGPEEFAKSYQTYRELQNFKATARNVIRKEPGIVQNLRTGLNTLIDGSQVARDIDKRTGTNLSETLLDGTEKINRYQVDLARWIKAKSDIPDLDEKTNAAVYRALDTGDTAGLSKEAMDTVKKWKSFYSDAADYAKEMGVPIQKMENYVPRKMVPMANAVVKIKNKVAELGGEEAIFKKLQTEEGRDSISDLTRAVSYFNGGKSLNDSPQDFINKLHEMQQPGSDAFLKEKVASALFRREDLLPEFLRDNDLRRLSNNWLMESLRYGHMRPTLDELGRQRDLLKAAGAEPDVEYLDDLVNDYLGGARGLAKVTRNGTAMLQVKALESAEKAAPGTFAKGFYTTLAETPEAVQNMVLNVYPNFLGLSPRAMIQNVVGGFYTMIPELGLTYGIQRGLPAYKNAMTKIAKNRGKYFKEMEEAGFIAPQWTTDLREALKTGTTKTGARAKATRAMEGLSEFSMKGFEASEKLNRAVAWETGKLLTKDLIAGAGTAAGKSAAQFLDTMPGKMAQRAKALAASGNEKELERLVTKYFSDRTLFSYNRLTQSDLARQAGPLFSMFTKFPAAVSGQVASAYRERGAVGGSSQVMRKLMAPYVAGSLLSNYVFEKDSDVKKALFGKDAPGATFGTGLASASPVGGLKSIAGGRIFTPPVVGTVKELSSAVLEGDDERLARWAKGTAGAFAPGGLAGYQDVLSYWGALPDFLTDKDDK